VFWSQSVFGKVFWVAMGTDTQQNIRLRRLLLRAALTLILLLIAISIYGAFIGAEAAQAFFNSIPLAIYWLAFTALLISAISTFRRLLQIRGLFLKSRMHYSAQTQSAQAKW
jgi:hypothetical protein